MMKNAVILVDGQNLYYSLKSMSIKECEIDWTKLFCDLVDSNHEFSRAYWFRAAKLHDTHYTKDSITYRIYEKHYNNHLSNFVDKNFIDIPKKVQDDVQLKVDKADFWLREQRCKFNSLEYVYDQLSLNHDNIEIVKSGVIKINPYNEEYIGEKGVDISLAVKMMYLSFHKQCDKIILVSGDYDYSEAIKCVKNNMTKVHIVKLHKGFPPKSRNMSRDLSVLADKVIDLYESDLRGIYKK